MTRRRWLMLVLAAAAVLLIVGRELAVAYADYLWYESLGAVALWRLRETSLLVLRGGSGVAAAAFAFANLYAVRQSVVSLVFPRRVGNLEIGEEVPGRYLVGAALALSILLGALLTMPEDNWMSYVLARSGRVFNETEPYFGADLGFFVYWLPLENALWMWAFFTVVVVSVAVVLLYALTPSLKWQRGEFYVSTYVRRHVTVLGGILLLLLAWSFRLDMYTMLANGSGIDGAFTYVDHHIGVPGDLLLALATLGAALIVLWSGFVGQLRLASISVLTVVGLTLIVREVAPPVARHLGTEPARVAREAPYVATRAAYTRRAFGVDRLPRADTSMMFPSLSAALPWLSIWDAPALAEATDAGRASDDPAVPISILASPSGAVANVVDAPPPGASARAPWTVARVLADDADERGAPVHVADAAGGSGEDAPIEAPIVHPGATRYSIIADSLTHTTGTPLETFLTRLAVSWSLQNFRLVTEDLPQPHPTLIAHRDVRDRVARYAPFFAQGRSVQPLLLGDSLFWATDLYSWSDTYPLSRHELIVGDDRSYFRHAAVAIVQGSTGEVVVVPDSVLDPIAASWVRRLPSLFGTWSGLPTGLRAQLAPPIDGITAQASAFGQFGARADTASPRSIPIHDGADSAVAADPLPFLLPGSHVPAFAFPLIDETDRLHGLLIGTGGASHVTVWAPLPSAGARWSAIVDRLRSVDSAGSAAREGPLAHGRIRAVPMRTGIAFVQPTYRWRPQNVPSLSRVAFLAGDTARSVAPPITAGSPAPVAAMPPHVAPKAPSSDVRAAAAALYTQMRDALRRGDWTAFGRAFDSLGQLLQGRTP